MAPTPNRNDPPFSRSVGGLLKDACIIGGDFNATTFDGDSTCLTQNDWKWLQLQEKNHALVDFVRKQVDPPPFY